jgi:hypothetical protein
MDRGILRCHDGKETNVFEIIHIYRAQAYKYNQ